MCSKILGKHICCTQLTFSTWQDNCFNTVWGGGGGGGGKKHGLLCQIALKPNGATDKNPYGFLPCLLSNSFIKTRLPRAIKVTCKLQDEQKAFLLFLSFSEEQLSILLLW